MKLNEVNEGNAKGISILIVTILAVVVVIVIVKKVTGIGDSIGEAIGLKDTKDEKENKAAIKSSVNKEVTKGVNSFWSPNFYKGAPNGTSIMTVAAAKAVAKRFWDSVGYVYDTPSEGAAALRQCDNGAQLSWVAANFYSVYGLDLLSWLQDKYDTSGQQEILADMMRYANNLPKY